MANRKEQLVHQGAVDDGSPAGVKDKMELTYFERQIKAEHPDLFTTIQDLIRSLAPKELQEALDALEVKLVAALGGMQKCMVFTKKTTFIGLFRRYTKKRTQRLDPTPPPVQFLPTKVGEVDKFSAHRLEQWSGPKQSEYMNSRSVAVVLHSTLCLPYVGSAGGATNAQEEQLNRMLLCIYYDVLDHTYWTKLLDARKVETEQMAVLNTVPRGGPIARTGHVDVAVKAVADKTAAGSKAREEIASEDEGDGFATPLPAQQAPPLVQPDFDDGNSSGSSPSSASGDDGVGGGSPEATEKSATLVASGDDGADTVAANPGGEPASAKALEDLQEAFEAMKPGFEYALDHQQSGFEDALDHQQDISRQRADAVDARINAMEDAMDARINAMEDAMDARINAMEASHEEKINASQDALDAVKRRFTGLKQFLGEI